LLDRFKRPDRFRQSARFRWLLHGLAALLLIAAIVTPASIHAQDRTAEEKYRKLVEKGVFEGFGDDRGENDLDMTRAQLAKIISLILDLKELPEAASIYSDLEEAAWAAGYIGAATAAGILHGRGGGIFDPSENVTIQELAKVYVEILGLEYDREATVEGADDWAGGYVQAAIQAGLIPEMSDYTVPATRQILVEASYAAQEQLNAKAVVKSADQTGARRVTLSLGEKVDPETFFVRIERADSDGSRTTVGIERLEWSNDGWEVTIHLDEAFQNGGYDAVFEIARPEGADVYSLRFIAEAERLVDIELGGADTLPRADGVEVPVHLFNQFGERMDGRPDSFALMTAPEGSALHPDRNVIMLDLAEYPAPGFVLVVADGPLMKIRTYMIGDAPVVQSVESGGFANESGSPVSRLSKGESAYLLLRPYDQYGNLIADLDWLNENVKAEVTVADVHAATSAARLVPGPNGAAAVRVTAGSYWHDTVITVTVRSPDGRELARDSITALTDPIFLKPVHIPVPTVSIDENSIVTVTDATYVTVRSANASELHYALVIAEDPETPTAGDLLASRYPSGAVDFGTIGTSGELTLKLNTATDRAYRLYVVGTASGGSRVSNLAVAYIDTDSANVFKLDGLVDAPDFGSLVIRLQHTPVNARGQVYFLVSEQPVAGIAAPDDLVRLVSDSGYSDDFVSRGWKPWNGISDQIYAGVADYTKRYHAYVVLEYRGIRLMATGMLNDGN